MVSVGSATLPGTRYGALNQDYVITDSIRWSDGRPPCYMAIVMDGHGMLGEEAARIAGDTILASLKTAFGTKSLENLKEAEVERIFTDAFETAHTAALDAYTQAPTYYVYPKDHALERRYTLGSHAGHAVYRHPITGPRVLEYGTTAAAVVVQVRKPWTLFYDLHLVTQDFSQSMSTYGAVN